MSVAKEPLMKPKGRCPSDKCWSKAKINTRLGPLLSPTAVSALWRVRLPFIGFGIAHLM